MAYEAAHPVVNSCNGKGHVCCMMAVMEGVRECLRRTGCDALCHIVAQGVGTRVCMRLIGRGLLCRD